MTTTIDRRTDWTAIGAGELADVVALRRAIHAEPEIGNHCPRTTEKLKAALVGLPLEIHDSKTTTGFVAILRGGRAGQGSNTRTVLLRGDMDALPMSEETGLDFASTVPGAMHACGHDAHCAMLAGAARALCARKEQLSGTVVFMFQPGEEGQHGARHMIEDGLLDIARPDAAFALHISPNAPAGLFIGREGPLLASTDTVNATIRGKGGHGSTPELCHDPIIPAAQIVNAFQTIVSREICPRETAVISLGKFQSNSNAFNIIPETVFMNGTVRTFNPKVQDHIEDAMNRIVTAHCAAARCSAELKSTRAIPATINDPAMTDILTSAAKELIGAENILETELIMGSEDFSFFLQKIPGTYFNLGTRNVAKGTDKSHHSPVFNLDEDALATGTALMASFAWKYLSSVC